MPIFEYECGGCGERFEELMSRSDPDPPCPACEGTEVTRLISNTSFRLKGSGWFTTDYPSTSKKGNGAQNEQKETSSASEASDSGAETKAKADNGTKDSGDGTAKKSKGKSAGSTATAS